MSNFIEKFLSKGSTFQVIRRDLPNGIRKKRPGAEIKNFFFHLDDAPAHRAEGTLLVIDFLHFERINHASYSLDCATMDCAFFQQLKSDLRGRRFIDFLELRMAFKTAISGFDKTR